MAPKKATETTLTAPAVKNNIDLSLNKDDIIELALQQQLEIVEDKLKVKYKELKEKKEAIEKAREDSINKIINVPVNSKEAKVFKEFAEKMGVEAQPKHEAASYDREKIEIGEYEWCDVDDSQLDEYKNGLAHFRRSSYIRKHTMEIHRDYYVSLSARSEDEKFKASLKFNTIRLTAANIKEIRKAIEKAAQGMPELRNEVHQLRQQRMECMFGEKRLKARFLKNALNNSEEGRGILAILEQASNMKLLS